MDLHTLNEHGLLLPLGAALNGVAFGYSLAERRRWGTVWFGFWMLACLAAA
jgi:hypothetical protein